MLSVCWYRAVIAAATLVIASSKRHRTRIPDDEADPRFDDDAAAEALIATAIKIYAYSTLFLLL
jgi:hypothetical protein